MTTKVDRRAYWRAYNAKRLADPAYREAACRRARITHALGRRALKLETSEQRRERLYRAKLMRIARQEARDRGIPREIIAAQLGMQP